ncbi:MAG: AraC family transcriptional regulator [Gemmatimonadales bacterium]|nr:AraC family transcriptional regulator [Gemmatimonadales bacterium]
MPRTAAIQTLRQWHPTPGVTLREKSYAPGVILDPHAHDHATLILVLGGGFREECGGEELARRPGELRFIPPDMPHSNSYGSGGARSFLVEISVPWLRAFPARSKSVKRSSHWQVGTQPALLAQRMYEDFRTPDDAATLSVEGLLFEMLAWNLRTGSSPQTGRIPTWLTAVRNRLHDEFADPPRLAELALEAGVHPAHLHRAFRAHFRCTPGEYVREVRLQWARHALVGTADRISLIAQKAGFSDHAHFTRRFRARVGVSPAQFRKLHQ